MLKPFYKKINKKYKHIRFSRKHYENLVEALTNNAIDNVISSSTTISSSTHSSSIFPTSSNQSDTHRKEESEIYDNDEGNIAD